MEPLGETPDVRYTIAEVARRTGMSVHTLRAWERRYGIPAPARSLGRYRLYGAEDIDLIRRVQAAVADGASPRQAAEQARAGVRLVPAGTAGVGDLGDQLVDACTRFDGEAAERVMSRGISALGALGLLDHVVEPVLQRIGVLWATGAVGVDVEHFASGVVRSRLGALLGSMEGVGGRRALLACPPGERHDLPLVCLAVRMRRVGWMAEVLGADLPVADLVDAVRRFQPLVVGISVTHTANLRAGVEAARAAREVAPADSRVLLGGQGISGDLELPPGVEHQSVLAAVLRGGDAGAGPEPAPAGR